MVRRPKLALDCECICHEDFGGSAHPKQRCRCRNGPGFEDLHRHLLVRLRRGKPLPPLRIDGDIIEIDRGET